MCVIMAGRLALLQPAPPLAHGGCLQMKRNTLAVMLACPGVSSSAQRAGWMALVAAGRIAAPETESQPRRRGSGDAGLSRVCPRRSACPQGPRGPVPVPVQEPTNPPVHPPFRESTHPRIHAPTHPCTSLALPRFCRLPSTHPGSSTAICQILTASCDETIWKPSAPACY